MTVVNRAAVEVADQDVEFFSCMSKSGIAGLYGRFNFSTLRFFHTDSYNECTSLKSHQQ